MAEDLLQMQQEAARRVRRMQEHSRRVFEEHQPHPSGGAAAYRPSGIPSPGLYRRPIETAAECPPAPCPQPVSDTGRTGGMDTAQLLLLGLALLLFRSGCRPELAAALLYLAM